MIKRKNSISSVLQVNERDFRMAGSHGDLLMSVLRGREEDVVNNALLVRTNLEFQHPSLEIRVFNQILQRMRFEGVKAIQIVLD